MTGAPIGRGEPHTQVRKPSFWLTLTEPMRAALEVSFMFARLPKLMEAPRGDGHTVMVLPGFATSDFMTQALRNYLSWLGYDSEPWRLGFNTGYHKLGEEQTHLRARLSKVTRQSRHKVSLIGWSLGGTMARQMAREHPEWVRRVITLGSPFTGNPNAIAIRRMYERVSGETVHSDEWRARFERDRAAPEVPTTAIYSQNDGITAWQNCVEQPGPHIENIEVGGSHLGLTHNPDVLLHISRILARPELPAQLPVAMDSLSLSGKSSPCATAIIAPPAARGRQSNSAQTRAPADPLQPVAAMLDA